MPGDEPRIVGARSLTSGDSFLDTENSNGTAKLRPKHTSTLQSHHPFEDQEKLRSCVRLLDAKAFQGLPNPLPRAQDLPEEYFGTPCFGDQVVSVSHAWRNQAHPDPTCCKTKLLAQLLSQLNIDGGLPSSTAVGREPRVFLFLDFISIPQKPFRVDQEPRTPLQSIQFQAALECMHEAFYYSDRIIHLPWENVPVPGEGVDHIVPAVELQNAVFAQVGDAVQIAGYRTMPTTSGDHPCSSLTLAQVPTTSSGHRRMPTLISSSSSAQQAHLFDQVMSADNQQVSTVAQVEDLLRQQCTLVRLRSYPFGMSTSIPADVRGWVFLERFISMVKCAMMDEETAKQIIITPSEGIFQEIMNGASRLREAALQDMGSRKSEELKRVLESFIVELHNKQFTAASTDKRALQEQEQSMSLEDRNIVHSIMREFVAHLALHWEAEAAKQRSFATRFSAVVAATENFLLEWDSFSEDYANQVANASRVNPWPVAIMVFVPLLPVASMLLPPYTHPDNDWTEQSTFWGCSFVMCFWAFVIFPFLLAHSAGVSCNATLYLRFILWGLGVAAAGQLAAIGVAVAADVFPVPALNGVYTVVGSASLPFLWWCIPLDKRASSQFRVRLIYSLIVVALVMSLFGVCTVLLNTAISHVSTGWQMVLVGGYLAIKLIFEGCGVAFSRHLGADTMTIIIFFATCCYQINLCMALSNASSWLIVVEQICFDVLENVYHLCSIRSPRNTARHEQYIVASLVLREFVELMVPVQFLIMHWLVKTVRPQYSTLLCNKSEEEVRYTESVLQADILVELLVSCLTYILLVRRGHAPLLMLRGLVATRLMLMVVLATGIFVFYYCMTHTHWGMDLSFRFVWLSEAEAKWECGLTWHVPG